MFPLPSIQIEHRLSLGLRFGNRDACNELFKCGALGPLRERSTWYPSSTMPREQFRIVTHRQLECPPPSQNFAAISGALRPLESAS
jgi:hypothetical protein